MDSSLPAAAGAVATVVFACSVLPMLGKAVRSKDLASYSRSNLVLANVGNVVYSLYVFDLPAGPIWVLHTFYLSTSALMLTWCLRYRHSSRSPVVAAQTEPQAGSASQTRTEAEPQTGPRTGPECGSPHSSQISAQNTPQNRPHNASATARRKATAAESLIPTGATNAH